MKFWPVVGDEQPPSNIINVFQPFPYAPDPELMPDVSAIDLVKFHFSSLFGTVSDTLLKYMAIKAQRPRSRPPMILVYGPFGGEGKSTIKKLFAKLFGPKYVWSTVGTKDITGDKQSERLETSLITMCEEGDDEGKSIISESLMKTYIDPGESTYRFRLLYHNSREIDNFAWTWFFTNYPKALKATGAWARRTCFTKASDVLMDNAEHFTKLYAMMEDSNAINSIYQWLLRMDVSDIDITDPKSIPQTDYSLWLKDSSLSTLQKWLIDLCRGERDNEAVGFEPIKHADEILYKYTDVYADFTRYCDDNGVHGKFVPTKISVRDTLADMGMQLDTVRKIDGRSGRYFILDLALIQTYMRKLLRLKNWVLVLPKNQE
jgi:hypothetical protein